MMTRRRFLASAAGTAAAVAATSVEAFSVEEMPAPVSELYRNACAQRQQLHEALAAEITAMIEDEATSQEERQRLARGVPCPVCGCPVAPAA